MHSTYDQFTILNVRLMRRKWKWKCVIFKCYSSEELITLNTLHEVVPTWYSFHSWVDGSNADKVSCSRRKHIDAEVRTRDICIKNPHSSHYANCSIWEHNNCLEHMISSQYWTFDLCEHPNINFLDWSDLDETYVFCWLLVHYVTCWLLVHYVTCWLLVHYVTCWLLVRNVTFTIRSSHQHVFVINAILSFKTHFLVNCIQNLWRYINMLQNWAIASFLHVKLRY